MLPSRDSFIKFSLTGQMLSVSTPDAGETRLRFKLLKGYYISRHLQPDFWKVLFAGG